MTYLLLLLGTQPVATDLYLLALPQIAASFGGQAAQVKWTLTCYILAFGLTQLVAGSLTDYYGRRRMLLWGLAVYACAGMMSAFAPGLALLLAFRALQGAATAVCIICVRAAIRDSYSATYGMAVMAKSMSGMSVIALTSPLIGALTTGSAGWHVTIALTGLFGIGPWLLVWLTFSETYVKSADQSTLRTLDYLRDRQFLSCSLLAGMSYSGAIRFLLLSPFIFIGQFGMPAVWYGMVPALCSCAFFIGTMTCRKLLQRMSVPTVVRIGACLTMAGGACQLLLWLVYGSAPWILLAPQCIYMLGHGFHQPCGQGGTVAPFPANAGRAAAISGFILTSMAFLVGELAACSMMPASQTLVTAMTLLTLAISLLNDPVTGAWEQKAGKGSNYDNPNDKPKEQPASGECEVFVEVEWCARRTRFLV
jgi:DHA1 family bicyclomycin/chloramphenicol resistance-like MFS transporter